MTLTVNPKSGRLRDQQRSRVYDAQSSVDHKVGLSVVWSREARGGRGGRVERYTHKTGLDSAFVAAQRLDTMEELTAFVRKVESSAWYRRTFPLAPREMTVKDGRRQRSATGGRNGIDMPRWSRCKLIVLHEMTHVLCIRMYSDTEAAWHGWQFCAIYLQLVKHVLGADAHAQLKAAFKANRVRYTEPRKRAPMSEERKAELREQLARARAAKAASKGAN